MTAPSRSRPSCFRATRSTSRLRHSLTLLPRSSDWRKNAPALSLLRTAAAANLLGLFTCAVPPLLCCMLKCRVCCHAEVPNLMPLLVGATKVWWIKCRSLTNKNWIDDGEMEEEGLGEMLLDDNSTAQIARPGTSFTRPESSAVGGPSPAVRPTSTGGRPLSGFARPGSGLARGGTGMSLERAMTSRCFPLVQQLPRRTRKGLSPLSRPFPATCCLHWCKCAAAADP